MMNRRKWQGKHNRTNATLLVSVLYILTQKRVTTRNKTLVVLHKTPKTIPGLRDASESRGNLSRAEMCPPDTFLNGLSIPVRQKNNTTQMGGVFLQMHQGFCLSEQASFYTLHSLFLAAPSSPVARDADFFQLQVYCSFSTFFLASSCPLLNAFIYQK